MSETNFLLKEKETILLALIDQMTAWDYSTEMAIDIMGANDERFKELQAIDQKLSESDLWTFNDCHNHHWQKVIQVQKEMMQALQSERQNAQGQLSQIDKKQKVVSNYMAVKNTSIFIEKDY